MEGNNGYTNEDRFALSATELYSPLNIQRCTDYVDIARLFSAVGLKSEYSRR